eukprot:TRINITY_DN19317_c0_g1_i1.p1 TRINITY_DN19317_c0_g1~~TRINITY_DN19317_c0_g1_i1.p1  ORF type:complete len:307 (+),score=41.89 TRINITY_DN19317_c0_g1_i1:68-922(+)
MAAEMSGDPSADELSLLTLPAAAWHGITSRLHAHLLLGRVAACCTSTLFLLAEESSWSTLALPAGARRVDGALKVMLVEERDLWAPLLRCIRVVDLSLAGTTQKTAKLVRELLLRALDSERNLSSVHLRDVPLCHSIDRAPAGPGRLSAKDRRLVNPVVSTLQVTLLRIFLLDPADLGRIRFKLSSFQHFRLGPSAVAGEEPALDLVAARNAPDQLGQGDGACCAVNDDGDELDPAGSRLELELGALRSLEAPPTWVDGSFVPRVWDFDSLAHALRPTYSVLSI